MNAAMIKKLDGFFSGYKSVDLPKGKVFIDVNKDPQYVFYIEEGVVRQYWIFENGNEITLNLYKPHTFLPMSWAIGNVANAHIYAALTNVKTKRAPKDAFLKFLKKEPEIVYDLLRRVYVGMEGLWTHMELLTTGNSQTKLAAALVILGKRFGKKTIDGSVAVQIRMGEQAIADYAGISRETASRELQKLKKQHIASFEKGTIVVEDMDKLEDLLLV